LAWGIGQGIGQTLADLEALGSWVLALGLGSWVLESSLSGISETLVNGSLSRGINTGNTISGMVEIYELRPHT
jgi:hypothetical protein